MEEWKRSGELNNMYIYGILKHYVNTMALKWYMEYVRVVWYNHAT